ncbi:MAG: hypothetical protein ACFFGZ_20110, partial [Candidatus Thorarchaeota archaeon]
MPSLTLPRRITRIDGSKLPILEKKLRKIQNEFEGTISISKYAIGTSNMKNNIIKTITLLYEGKLGIRGYYRGIQSYLTRTIAKIKSDKAITAEDLHKIAKQIKYDELCTVIPRVSEMGDLVYSIGHQGLINRFLDYYANFFASAGNKYRNSKGKIVETINRPIGIEEGISPGTSAILTDIATISRTGQRYADEVAREAKLWRKKGKPKGIISQFLGERVINGQVVPGSRPHAGNTTKLPDRIVLREIKDECALFLIAEKAGSSLPSSKVLAKDFKEMLDFARALEKSDISSYLDTRFVKFITQGEIKSLKRLVPLLEKEKIQ